jgi:hypothetical protein
MADSIRTNPLFRSRDLKSSLELAPLDAVFPGGKPVTRVYLLAPSSAGQHLAERYGIEHNKLGASFALDSEVDLTAIPSELLPFFARPKVAPFMSDLAPNNSWGGSLGALLSSQSIQPFAEAASRKFADKCYLCGTPRFGGNAPAHHPRAWWGYAEPTDGAVVARQFLLAITPMCRDCTDMLQLARGYDATRRQATVARMTRVFRFSRVEMDEYQALVQERAERHSRYLWAADLSRVFSEATVHLQASWEHRADSGIPQPIVYRAASGNGTPASLLLCGVRYVVGGSHRVHYFA